MPRRRSLVTVLLVAAAGCSSSAATDSSPQMVDASVSTADVTSSRPGEAMPDLAVVNAAGEVAIVRDGATVDRFSGAVAASVPVAVRLAGSGTTLEWVDLVTGAVTASRPVEPGLQITAIDPHGRLVGLVSRPDAAAGATAGATIAPGRSRSVILVVDPVGGEYRVELDGNHVPEAFGAAFQTDASSPPVSVFLLEYLPAAAPTHYRVRVLDTLTDALSVPLNLRDKTQQLDEQMAGLSRSQVVAERDGLLFTLYRGANPDGSTYAFVHTLGVANGVWCLFPDEAMELATRPGAIATDDRTRSLFAASANGMVGRFDVARVLDAAMEPSMSTVATVAEAVDVPPAIAAGDGAVWAAFGASVVALDPLSLTVEAGFTSPVTVSAISELGDGHLVLAGSSRIAIVDAVSGALLDEVDLERDDFGDVTRLIPL